MRPKDKYLTTPVKQFIVQARRRGEKISKIALQFNVNKGTVSRICKRYKDEGTVHRYNKPGRPRKLTPEEERHLFLLSKRNKKTPATDLVRFTKAYLNKNCSVYTIRRILKRHGLLARRPAYKPLLAPLHRNARLRFARLLKYWTLDKWQRVIFSDEAKFELIPTGGVRWIRRPAKKRFAHEYVLPTAQHGGGESVMVWGMTLKNLHF